MANATQTSININQFADLIATVGQSVTVIGQGEPGIGKSAALREVGARFPSHKQVYMDAALLDLGDLQMPLVNETSGVKFIPNNLLVSQDGAPLLVMVDEIGKAMRPVQNALLPLLLEQRLGSHKLPEGSIVFGTTNLASDGVGDTVQAHARNRVCWVTVRKPDAEMWLKWAVDNDIDAAIQRWVQEYPHCLASYTDEGQGDNPYVFNPKKVQHAFVSPRSLEMASHVAKVRHALEPDLFVASVAGLVGESAARDMQAFFAIGDGLPRWDSIMSDPKSAKVPDNAIAQSILAMGAATRLKKEEINPWMDYMLRLEREVQALFATQIMASSRAPLICVNKKFTAWATEASFLF